MSQNPEKKNITLQPSWKNHFLGYLFSVLLIPLFGIGLIGFYLMYKKQKKYSYTFTDTQISSRDDKYQRNIDLVNIEQLGIEQNWLQKKMAVGDIVLRTTATKMVLRGINNPQSLQDMLEQAISVQKELAKKKEKSKPKQPEGKPGSMERINYLTGLWQQGLVSDNDFKKEKKHFE